MIVIKDSIEISRTPQQVYSYVVDLENVPRWQPAVIEVKRLTEGPTRVGSQFREVAKMMGRKIRTTCEIKRLDPGKLIAFGVKDTSKNPYPWKRAVRLSLSKPCCSRVLGANRFRQAQSDRVFRGALKSDGPLEYETTYSLEPTAAGTRLNINGHFRTKGFLRLLEPIIKGQVRKESKEKLAKMKKVIEEIY